ncbi:MAG: DsbA family oxidoreductase [Rhodospirillaceae bacterium]|nr:DsbA family oxidoreductase [Rhodospirillaceae bacterium]MBT6116261.1 DsbA family oxidoreductase [Rhodospirillaceae bacterium]
MTSRHRGLSRGRFALYVAAMHLDIVSDTICPWCYIGKRRFERALAAQPQPELTVLWRPFQLNPDMPPEGMARKDYLAAKFGGSEGAEHAYTPVQEAGAGESIPFDFEAMPRTPNTLLSHRLIRWAGEQGNQDALVETLFKAYFTKGRDIGDLDTLVELAVLAGADGDAARRHLESEEGLREVQAEDQLARQSGINGVPAFILNRKYLISGAQPPEAFLQALTQVREEEEAGAEMPAAGA